MKQIPARKIIPALLITEAGFMAAILGNYFIPQVAKGIKITQYDLFGLSVNLNSFYRIVLAFVMMIFFLLALKVYIWPAGRKSYIHNALFRFAVGIALLLYDITGTKLRITPQPFFPGPAQILEAFLMEGGYIWANMLYSLRLFGVGFSSGVILGVGTGILIGWFPNVYYWVYPVLKMTGIIPAVAWMPFALTLFPTPFLAAVFLIAICSWFPVASQTAFGVQSTEKSLFETARTLGARTPWLVFHVAVPNAMPQIFTGITTACASSFTCLVIAEMMGQPGGLGYYINLVKVWAAYYKVFAAILVMAVMFSLILAVLNLIKAHVLRWQEGKYKS